MIRIYFNPIDLIHSLLSIVEKLEREDLLTIVEKKRTNEDYIFCMDDVNGDR